MEKCILTTSSIPVCYYILFESGKRHILKIALIMWGMKFLFLTHLTAISPNQSILHTDINLVVSNSQVVVHLL